MSARSFRYRRGGDKVGLRPVKNQPPESDQQFDVGSTDDSLERMIELFARYGDIYRVYVPARKSYTYVIHHPDDVKRVLVSNQPVATFADTTLVAGCAFNVSGKPQPCIKVQWLVPAARVMVNHQPALLQTSAGLCQSAEQIPQGPPNVVAGQVRVKGT